VNKRIYSVFSRLLWSISTCYHDLQEPKGDTYDENRLVWAASVFVFLHPASRASSVLGLVSLVFKSTVRQPTPALVKVLTRFEGSQIYMWPAILVSVMSVGRLTCPKHSRGMSFINPSNPMWNNLVAGSTSVVLLNYLCSRMLSYVSDVIACNLCR
jgi:hypothetical protein